MVQSKATTVEAYLAALPAERRGIVQAVREEILAHLPAGMEEGMQFGMIGYYIPLARYPKTYNGQALNYAALASQKQYLSVYLHGLYAVPRLADWFTAAYRRSGKKLDMGKSCVRFRHLEDLPLALIGEAVGKMTLEDYLRHYEAVKGKP